MMKLQIQKSQATGEDGLVQFVVTCTGLDLTYDELGFIQRYGAPKLKLLGDDVDAIRTGPGIERSFPTVADAERYIQDVLTACEATEAYWKEAATFGGGQNYPPEQM
jgi:hypothetical protein